MSCLPGYSGREQRLMRAFQHYALRNHELDPAGCDGCLEAVAFLAIAGYQGDLDQPTCVVVVDGDHYRDERSGLKHGQVALPRRTHGISQEQ